MILLVFYIKGLHTAEAMYSYIVAQQCTQRGDHVLVEDEVVSQVVGSGLYVCIHNYTTSE